MFTKIKKIGICWALFIALFSMENYASSPSRKSASFTHGDTQYVYCKEAKVKIQGKVQIIHGWIKNGSLGSDGSILYSDILNIDTLQKHLLNEGSDALRELGRLILVQNMKKFSQYNCPENSSFPYLLGIPLYQYKVDLLNTIEMLELVNRMFDHGHMGYYPFSNPYKVDCETKVCLNPFLAIRGMFNIDRFILKRISQRVSKLATGFADSLLSGCCFFDGYEIDPAQNDGSITLRDVACNIIKTLFSDKISDLTFGIIRNVQNTFEIDFTYDNDKGKIPGLEGFLGMDSYGKVTDRVRLVVGLSKGDIRLVTLYPI